MYVDDLDFLIIKICVTCLLFIRKLVYSLLL